MTCTFFGHRDVVQDLKPLISKVCAGLIETGNVDRFYVGNEGSFDLMVQSVLCGLEKKYDISYEVVLAYLPKKTDILFDDVKTLFPEGMEKAHPRFVIDKRNRWMVQNSDIAVTYVKKRPGGAAKFKELAEKKGKTIIELSEYE